MREELPGNRWRGTASSVFNYKYKIYTNTKYTQIQNTHKYKIHTNTNTKYTQIQNTHKYKIHTSTNKKCPILGRNYLVIGGMAEPPPY